LHYVDKVTSKKYVKTFDFLCAGTVELVWFVNSLNSLLFRWSRQNSYLLCTFLFV